MGRSGWRHSGRSKTVVTGLGALAVVLSLGCPGPQNIEPDLVPERRSGGSGAEGFCRRDNAGNLIVRVRNQTNFGALTASVTRVTFSVGGPVSRPTPPIGAGASADVIFPIPAGCFSPDCTFAIAVDADNQIDESHGTTPDNHETNNNEPGICIG